MRISDWSSDVCSSDLLSRRTSRFAIRGQGGGTGVVTYFADVPSFGLESNFFDLDNVQVIKGPVGTLFGRVTTGGAVLFSPTGPGDEFEGFVDLKVGEHGRRDVEFAVRSEEHTSELQSLMRISYAVFCLKKKIKY